MTTRVELEKQAARSLVSWRIKWEREHDQAPGEIEGHALEVPLWNVAGRLMRSMGMRPRLP